MKRFYLIIATFCSILVAKIRCDLPKIETYLINLKERSDKLAVSKFQLDLLGINFTRIEGISGKQIYDLNCSGNKSIRFDEITGIEGLKLKVGFKDNPSIRIGAIGCWLSHLKALQHIINAPKDGISLILEDDFIADGNATQLLEKYLSKLPNDWEVYYAGHCEGRYLCKSNVLSDRGLCLAHKRMVACAHAFLIKNKEVAKRLFDHGNSDNPILADNFAHQGQTVRYMTFPHIFKQRKNIAADVKSSGGLFTSLLNSTLEDLINKNFK